MRIISKYKDYYDYFVGIFGIDDNKIYDRRELIVNKDPFKNSNNDDIDLYVFAIANTIYPLFYYRNKPYHTLEDIKRLEIIYRKNNDIIKSYRYVDTLHRYEELTKQVCTVNTDARKPVLVRHFRYYSYLMNVNEEFATDDVHTYVPLLSDFKFNNILDAKEIYIKIETFLGWLNDNPEIPNKQTDKEKLLSHGFDNKKSFRHRK